MRLQGQGWGLLRELKMQSLLKLAPTQLHPKAVHFGLTVPYLVALGSMSYPQVHALIIKLTTGELWVDNCSGL